MGSLLTTCEMSLCQIGGISPFRSPVSNTTSYHTKTFLGKGRTKKESAQHTNQHDPGGHTRKTTQKLINSHQKEKEQNLKKSDS